MLAQSTVVPVRVTSHASGWPAASPSRAVRKALMSRVPMAPVMTRRRRMLSVLGEEFLRLRQPPGRGHGQQAVWATDAPRGLSASAEMRATRPSRLCTSSTPGRASRDLLEAAHGAVPARVRQGRPAGEPHREGQVGAGHAERLELGVVVAHRAAGAEELHVVGVGLKPHQAAGAGQHRRARGAIARSGWGRASQLHERAALPGGGILAVFPEPRGATARSGGPGRW